MCLEVTFFRLIFQSNNVWYSVFAFFLFFSRFWFRPVSTRWRYGGDALWLTDVHGKNLFLFMVVIFLLWLTFVLFRISQLQLAAD